MINLQNLSDKDLYLICKKWGAAALEARRKFTGLLPEVYSREMAEQEKGRSWLKKRGFTCIYEFAAKLAGISCDQVNRVLSLEKRLENTPILREALVNGEVSVNKLARVVSIASAENQQALLWKVETLSNRALEVYVKDFRNQNGLGEPKIDHSGVHVHAVELNKCDTNAQSTKHEHSLDSDLNLDEDVKNELSEMQKKGININQLLREFLRARKEKMEQKKLEVLENQMRERDDRAIIGMPANRYVPVEVRKIVIREFGNKCSAPECVKPAENLHHENGFAIDQCHDPRYLKPLCIGHHELAHAD